jgi:hypothetical protein
MALLLEDTKDQRLKGSLTRKHFTLAIPSQSRKFIT